MAKQQLSLSELYIPICPFQEVFALIDEEEVWTRLLQLPPFCFYDDKLSFMTSLKEYVVGNIKVTKSFLEVIAINE